MIVKADGNEIPSAFCWICFRMESRGSRIVCLIRWILNKYFMAFYDLNGDGSILHRGFVFDCMMVLKTKRSRDFMMYNGAAIAAPLC